MKFLLGPRLQFDWKIVTVIVLSTLLLIVDWYPTPSINKDVERTIFYFVIPMLIILLVFRDDPREYGFTFGDWKAGLVITAIAILLIAPVLYYVSHGNVTMQNYYKSSLNGLPWNTAIDLFGWEFFFRGFILFAFYRKFGPEALWLQAVPFALAHLSKPEVETLSTIFGGFAFGWVAYRTRSFVYPFLIHWFVASFTVIVAAGLLG